MIEKILKSIQEKSRKKLVELLHEKTGFTTLRCDAILYRCNYNYCDALYLAGRLKEMDNPGSVKSELNITDKL